MSAEATVRMRALREAPLWLLAGAVLAFLVADRGTVAPLSPGGPAAALDLSSQVSERAARARTDPRGSLAPRDGRADAGVDEDHATPDHHIDRCAAAALENVDAVFGHLSKLGHLRRSAPLFRPPAGIAPRVRVAVPVPDVTRPPTSAAFRFTP